ncbi:unnamed protein product [Bursaphelenchus xylophilus]|uniref:(pine wood nematode) hypothetical protein n=1 Tax=Bursaphelenchus xylophilus TaxID=6326 RepID=A0A1I7RHK1_BURXY|nr:unnamed protein product [Bursaphelenchus xylophilus]CAG9115662.1 unnamed protein product [Bursaphelenchus xylophilus]
MDPPDTTVVYPTRTKAVLTCKATSSHLLISLGFIMILILACTIYAFKTRKIPENFNETRLIGFTMYSTSILWLAFGPIYFATQNNFKIQIASLCFCISMSGTVALACFFFPKVYIVLWQPYKNVRTRHSAVGKLVNQQMRFISQMTTPQSSHPPTRGIQEISTNYTSSCHENYSVQNASSSEASCTNRCISPPPPRAPQSTPAPLSAQPSVNPDLVQPSMTYTVITNVAATVSVSNGCPKGMMEEEDGLPSIDSSSVSSESLSNASGSSLRRRLIHPPEAMSPPPVQLILREISENPFSTFLYCNNCTVLSES